MDNFVLTEKGVVIKITNTSAEQVLTNDNGFISPTLKLSEEVVHKEIIPAFKIKIPAYVSYGVFDIAPGDSISFIVKKPNEVFYYIGLQDARMEGISISVTPVTDSLVLQDKVITPTTEEQVVTADEGYNGLGTVTVNAMNLIEKTITEDGIYSASDDNADGYSSVEITVSGSGGGSTGDFGDDVVLYDYDGSKIASYSKQGFLQLTSYPTLPTHPGLINQGYNWTLEQAKTYVTKYGKLNIGLNYITDDNATRIYINLDDEYSLSPTLCLNWGYETLSKKLRIDFGDNSEPIIVNDTSHDSENCDIMIKHNYLETGHYVISIYALDDTVYTGVWEAEGVPYTLFDDRATWGTFAQYYASTIEKIEIGTGFYSIGLENAVHLTTVTIPNNVKCNLCIYNYYNGLPFIKCLNFATINNPVMESKSGICMAEVITLAPVNEVVYTTAALTSFNQITYPENITALNDEYIEGIRTFSKPIIIPDTVIDLNITLNNEMVEELIIPNNVTTVEINGSGAIKELIIPDNVTSFTLDYGILINRLSVGSGIVSLDLQPYNVCELVLSEGLTTISNFDQLCLSTITFPSTVTDINSVFSAELVLIKFNSTTPPSIVEGAFDRFIEWEQSLIIVVPHGTLSAYTSAEYYPDPSSSLFTYIERPAT